METDLHRMSDDGCPHPHPYPDGEDHPVVFNQTNNAGNVNNSGVLFATRDEVIAAVEALCQSQYGGDYQAGFNHYAGPDGLVHRDGVVNVLEDAGVGSFLTRGLYASAVVHAIDKDGDGAISWDEFQAAKNPPQFPLPAAERRRHIAEIEVNLATTLQMSIDEVRSYFVVTWPEQSHYPCVTGRTGSTQVVQRWTSGQSGVPAKTGAAP